MKTYSKILLLLSVIVQTTCIVVGCSQRDESRETSHLNETKHANTIPNGTYSAKLKAKNGEVFTIYDKIVNGKSVKTTLLNSKGEETSLPDGDRIYESPIEMDAYDVFEQVFDEYDCIQIVVEDFVLSNSNTSHYYVIYAGSYDKKGDCWYD